MTEMRLPEVMPLADAAARVGCSARTLERARDRGELVCSQLAERGCWVVRREHLLAWIDARQQPLARPIIPTAGATRTAARAAVAARRSSCPTGPLAITDDMGRRAA